MAVNPWADASSVHSLFAALDTSHTASTASALSSPDIENYLDDLTDHDHTKDFHHSERHLGSQQITTHSRGPSPGRGGWSGEWDHVWELPYHRASEINRDSGGHWATERAVSYLKNCPVSPRKGTTGIPNVGWPADVAGTCARYAQDEMEPPRADLVRYFMPEEPVSSLYFPVIRIEENHAKKGSQDPPKKDVEVKYEDVILRGSIHDSAYFWADIYLRSRSPNEAPARQSLIVDTGSSLMSFPCETECSSPTESLTSSSTALPKRCEPHAKHIDAPHSISAVEHSTIPCSLSCRSCFLAEETIRKSVQGGQKAIDSYCERVLSEEIPHERTDSLFANKMKNTTNPENNRHSELPKESTFSRSDLFHLLDSNNYWADTYPDYRYPLRMA